MAVATLTPTTPATARKPLSVLAVDDEQPLCELFKIVLDDPRYRVTTAQDGGDALDILFTQPVDVLFTDLVMPDITGYQLIDTIRNDPEWEGKRNVFIIAMTGSLWLEARYSSESLGANFYIAKPLNKDRIFLGLGKYFEHAAQPSGEGV